MKSWLFKNGLKKGCGDFARFRFFLKKINDAATLSIPAKGESAGPVRPDRKKEVSVQRVLWPSFCSLISNIETGIRRELADMESFYTYLERAR